jgi:hypothetical protein
MPKSRPGSCHGRPERHVVQNQGQGAGHGKKRLPGPDAMLLDMVMSENKPIDVEQTQKRVSPRC